MQSPRKLDNDDDDESLTSKKGGEKDDKGWKLRARLVRDEQAGIFADGVSRYIVVKWMFVGLVIEVIFYLWLLQYRRANLHLDSSLPVILSGLVLIIMFTSFAGIGAWRRQPRRLRYGLVACGLGLVILAVPTYYLVTLQICDASACAIQDYPMPTEPGAPHTKENWKQCEMLGKLKRHFGLTFFFLADRPYSFNVHPTKDHREVSGSNALRPVKVPGTDIQLRKEKKVAMMQIAPVPHYYSKCDDVPEAEIFTDGVAREEWRAIWCPGYESRGGRSSLAELEGSPPVHGLPVAFVHTLASDFGHELAQGRYTQRALPGRHAVVREHRQTTEQVSLAAHDEPPEAESEVTQVAQEVAGIANDTRKLTTELNTMIAKERQVSNQVSDLQAQGATTPRTPRTPRRGILKTNATAHTRSPRKVATVADEYKSCKCKPGGCLMALGGNENDAPHARDRFWCKLDDHAAKACLDRFLEKRKDPTVNLEAVVGSPAWPVFISTEKASGVPYYWTYGLCEQERPGDWEPDTSGGAKKTVRLLSYSEESVQKRKCACKRGDEPLEEKRCEVRPWQDMKLKDVDYFFGYVDGCEVEDDSACYFKAIAKDPKTSKEVYFSFEPCGEWKEGSNQEVLESLVTFCEGYKLVTIVGFLACAVIHVYALFNGFIFYRNSCADPVGTTFTSFDTWADEKLDYDGDAWSDPWTDSD